jgi:glycosyltransferase involved in cell wall biosynthesis
VSLLFKIKLLLKEKRLPWFVLYRVKKLKNSIFFILNKSSNFFVFKNRKPKKLITYVCGFHGETGGAIAAASIANLLSSEYRVEFVTFLTSDINPLLACEVKVVRKVNFQSDLFICDAECEHTFYQKLRDLNKKLIISCHCLPDQSHGLKPEYIVKSLSYADIVHFVSDLQQDAFKLLNNACQIIPNTSQKVNKTVCTNNAGCVGNLSNVQKNVNKSIDIVLNSKANNIQLWSVKEDIWKHPRVITHSWESDKLKVYNSFDILVFMSEVETFGLVVIEAMSAGIPCILSNIPVFKQFKECPGVVVLDDNNEHDASNILNALLKDKPILEEKMKRYFDKTYSSKAIFSQWDSLVLEVLS